VVSDWELVLRLEVPLTPGIAQSPLCLLLTLDDCLLMDHFGMSRDAIDFHGLFGGDVFSMRDNYVTVLSLNIVLVSHGLQIHPFSFTSFVGSWRQPDLRWLVDELLPTLG